jgi:hypothetical protein
VNVQPLAKRWWKQTRAERPKPPRDRDSSRRGGYSLEFFEKGLGLGRPRHLATGNATKWLRRVREPLERHGAWSRLTRAAKAQWTELLAYNETDVRNLAALAQWVADRATNSRWTWAIETPALGVARLFEPELMIEMEATAVA